MGLVFVRTDGCSTRAALRGGDPQFERSADWGAALHRRRSWRKLNRFRILLVHLQMGASEAAGEDARAIAQLAGAAAGRDGVVPRVARGGAPARPATSVWLPVTGPPKEYVSRSVSRSARLWVRTTRRYAGWRKRLESGARAGRFDRGPVFDRLRAASGLERIADRVAVAAERGPPRRGCAGECGVRGRDALITASTRPKPAARWPGSRRRHLLAPAGGRGRRSRLVTPDAADVPARARIIEGVVSNLSG